MGSQDESGKVLSLGCAQKVLAFLGARYLKESLAPRYFLMGAQRGKVVTNQKNPKEFIFPYRQKLNIPHFKLSISKLCVRPQ